MKTCELIGQTLLLGIIVFIVSLFIIELINKFTIKSLDFINLTPALVTATIVIMISSYQYRKVSLNKSNTPLISCSESKESNSSKISFNDYKKTCYDL